MYVVVYEIKIFHRHLANAIHNQQVVTNRSENLGFVQPSYIIISIHKIPSLRMKTVHIQFR